MYLRRVDIINFFDDVIFSGSTIAKMVLSLKEIGVKLHNISILILALNKDTFKMHFADSDHTEDIFRIDDCAKLNNADCTRLCGNISRLLSVIGKPYDVDFPAYYDIFMKDTDTMPWAFLPQYWTLFNVSNEYHSQVGIEAYTIIPSNVITGMMWAYLGLNLDEIAEYKVRIYSFKNGEKKRYKVLPMVVFNEITFETLEVVFKKIYEKLEFGETDIKNSFRNNSAQMRLIQYYIANLLYCTFAFSCKLEIPAMRKYSLPYLFGYDYLELISEKMARSMKKYISVLRSSALEETSVEKLYCSNKINTLEYQWVKDDKLNTFDINFKLLSPFIYWYQRQEIPARKKLANPELNLGDDDLFKTDYRLEVGFSFRSLKSFLDYAKEYYNISSLVSVFIDRAVDLGLLVPIIYINNSNDTICRAFRHGEDLPFGDYDKEVL